MTTPTPTPPPENVGDLGTSLIRTYVPVLWGYLLTFVATRFPDFYVALDNPALVLAVGGVVTAAWYTLWRKLEPHVPGWLTRLLLGSVKAPTYPSEVWDIRRTGTPGALDTASPTPGDRLDREVGQSHYRERDAGL